MKEYRMTDGVSIIIETAKNERTALASAAARLECDESILRILEIKTRPVGCGMKNVTGFHSAATRTGRKANTSSVVYRNFR